MNSTTKSAKMKTHKTSSKLWIKPPLRRGID
jgi:hypothetical protein